MVKSEEDQVLVLYRMVLKLSEEMQSLARGAEWNALTAKETVRRALIEELRLTDVAVHTTQAFTDSKRSLIQAIMACDRETQEFTRSWSTELKEILDVLNAKKNFKKPMVPMVKLSTELIGEASVSSLIYFSYSDNTIVYMLFSTRNNRFSVTG